MNWSFRIAQVSGIDIKVHLTFFLILVLGGLQWSEGNGLFGVAFGVALMILLFVCVVLHELGHALVAQRFGIPVREMILLPLGGVALLGRNPDKPLHELLIAAAGPLVNVVIAALLYLPIGAALGMRVLDGRGLLEGLSEPTFPTLLGWLFSANVSLVIFNLIPAFPLDGGRMLRAILAMVLGYPRATPIATVVGQLIAVGLGVYALQSGNFVLALIAVFIFFGASEERNAGRLRQAQAVLTTWRVGDAYNKHALTLAIGDRVSKVVDYILTSHQPDFGVLQGPLIGIVTRDDVVRALASSGNDTYVTEIMRREFVKVNPRQSLDEVRSLMQEQSARIVAVYEGENYLGLVSIEDIAEAFAVLRFVRENQNALRPTASPSA